MTLAPPAPPTSLDRLGETTTLAVSYLRVSTKGLIANESVGAV